MNFPSVMYVFEAQKRRGARIHMVPSDDGIDVDTQRILDAIDETTLLVPISHVLFRSAFIQDAEAITEKAHEVGAHVILDVYQSAGTRAGRPHGARRRLRRRRLGQVALRRPGRGLPLRAAGPREEARADAHRLAGAPEARSSSRSARSATPTTSSAS